ncbi:hypothetical protein [Streptomyces sp. NPDC048590]|uniref:hypothetical protein n=1 Tax=Streptomyces sp. NPDC048590 TaxID=3365574 RepID=UPI0037141E02
MTTAAQLTSTPAARRPCSPPAPPTLILVIICVSYFMVMLTMALIGAGRGLTSAPLTSGGIDGVNPSAASGLGGTVHQIGSALAPSLLAAVAATASTDHSPADIAARSGAALTDSAVLLAPAAATVLALIVPARATRTERSL